MNPAWEALNQLIEGKDFDPPARLLSNIKPEAAVRVPAGAPYSVATNVAHTDIWNRVWLNQIEGKPRGNPFPDFPVIEEAAWAGVRERFLEHLVRARELAETQTNSKQVGRLIQIAVHTAYHVGQIKLLKRMLRGPQEALAEASGTHGVKRVAPVSRAFRSTTSK
ncbi:MAG TPA: DinB family protein [Fimbriimonadaceae bacterium]|nr:DinB family protein [Fimbriimonadaceae bacterium]